MVVIGHALHCCVLRYKRRRRERTRFGSLLSWARCCICQRLLGLRHSVSCLRERKRREQPGRLVARREERAPNRGCSHGKGRHSARTSKDGTCGAARGKAAQRFSRGRSELMSIARANKAGSLSLLDGHSWRERRRWSRATLAGRIGRNESRTTTTCQLGEYGAAAFDGRGHCCDRCAHLSSILDSAHCNGLVVVGVTFAQPVSQSHQARCLMICARKGTTEARGDNSASTLKPLNLFAVRRRKERCRAGMRSHMKCAGRISQSCHAQFVLFYDVGVAVDSLGQCGPMLCL